MKNEFTHTIDTHTHTHFTHTLHTLYTHFTHTLSFLFYQPVRDDLSRAESILREPKQKSSLFG